MILHKRDESIRYKAMPWRGKTSIPWQAATDQKITNNNRTKSNYSYDMVIRNGSINMVKVSRAASYVQFEINTIYMLFHDL